MFLNLVVLMKSQHVYRERVHPGLQTPFLDSITCLCNRVAFPETGHLQTLHQYTRKDANTVSDYFPISLTCIAGKVLERLVHNHLVQFLTTGNKLSPFQHSFRKGHSCQTQFLETVHEWALSLDGASSTHVIFTDFSEAFDSVPHKLLILKLEQVCRHQEEQ